jgi:hypothetical protein
MPSASELRENLKYLKVTELKDLIRKYNLLYVINGYSTFKKEELLSTIVNHFSTKTIPTYSPFTPSNKRDVPTKEQKEEYSKYLKEKSEKDTKEFEKKVAEIKIAIEKKQISEKDAKKLINNLKKFYETHSR